MADFGFVGDAYSAPSVTQDTQECINWRPEIDPRKQEPERGVIALYPTPGLILLNTIATGEVRALYVYPGGQTMYTVVANTLYKISASFSAVRVGTLATSVGQVGISSNGTSLYIVDGTNRYSYT